MWLERVFKRSSPLPSTPFSDFIRNASSAEKKKVYSEVMKKAAERQNALLASAKQKSAESA